MGQPGLSQKAFFLLKSGCNPHGEPGLPIFCKGFLGQDFLERAFWEGMDKLIEFLQFAKTAVLRRPLFASRMNQAGCNHDNNFHAFSNKDNFIVVDIQMANMDSLFFRVLLLYLYFLYLFVVGCLGHDFLDGLRPPWSLDIPGLAFFRCAISVVQGGPPFFV